MKALDLSTAEKRCHGCLTRHERPFRSSLPAIFVLALFFTAVAFHVEIAAAAQEQLANAAAASERPQSSTGFPGRICVATFATKTVEDRDGRPQILSVDPNTGESAKLHTGNEGVYFVRCSPDGRAVAFRHAHTYLPADSNVIWLTGQAERDVPSKLCERALAFAWLPDSKGLVVTTLSGHRRLMNDGRPVTILETYEIRSDRSNRKRLPIPDTHEVLDVSPDGELLLTVRLGRRKPWTRARTMEDVSDDLYVVDMAGAIQSRVTMKTESGIQGRFSPDGEIIAYRGLDEKKRQFVRVVGVDGLDRRTVVAYPPTKSPRVLSWSPDGKFLAIAIQKFERVSATSYVSTPARSIDVVNLEGNLVQVLQPTGGVWNAVLDIDWR